MSNPGSSLHLVVSRKLSAVHPRLVRMFSFHGDTLLDPFCGSGTTMLAALNTGRNSIGVDIDPEYCRMAPRRLDSESGPHFAQAGIEDHKTSDFLAPTNVPAVADAPKHRPTRRRSVRYRFDGQGVELYPSDLSRQ